MNTFFLTILSCVIMHYSHLTIPEIGERARKISREVDPEIRDTELYNYYSSVINEMDPDLLRQNPEILFKKALLGLETLYDDMDIDPKKKMKHLKNDFSLIMLYSNSNRKLYNAASYYKELIEIALPLNLHNENEVIPAFDRHIDELLRPFSSDSKAVGSKLRKQVIENLELHPEMQEDFYHLLKIFSWESCLILDEVEILEQSYSLDDQSYISYTIKYRYPGDLSVTTEIEGEI